MKKEHNIFNGADVVEMMNKVNNDICQDTAENDPKEFEKIEKLLYESFGLNKNKHKNKLGESSHSAVLANMMNAEISKKIVLSASTQNSLAKQIVDAYKQNKKIEKYLDNTDIFQFASDYECELNVIVESLFVGDEKFKQIVSRCLNYAQFSNIYAFDKEFEKMKKIKKRHTDFERAVFESNSRDAIMAVEPLTGLGQSAYIALFGGRTVCAGIATTTASIMDLAFQKCNIDAKAFVSSTDTHAFVGIEKGEKSYIVDPTNYYGSFKEILRDEKELAQQVDQKVKTFDLRKYDTDEHFAVVDHFVRKFGMQTKINKIINFDDTIPMKLAKIISFMQKNLSNMSKLIYPKAVIFDGYEINVQFCFEMCLLCAHIPYKTGCANDEFVIKNPKEKYIIDTSRIFDAKNNVNESKKFLFIKPQSEINRDL